MDRDPRFELQFNLHKIAMLDADEWEADYFGAVYRCSAADAQKWLEEFDASTSVGAAALAEKYPDIYSRRGEPSGTLCFVGDSITSDRESYGKIIAKFFKDAEALKIVDCAVSGWNSQSFVGWLFTVLQHKPKYVSMMVGTNDLRSNKDGAALSVTSIGEYERNMRYIIQSLREAGVAVCLTTPPPAHNPWVFETFGDRNWQYADETRMQFVEMNRTLANEYGLYLNDMEPIYAECKATDILLYDGLHLNVLGQRILAASLLPVLFDMMT
ncbi:MAG: SGNH/GDSL hydrolase family protein [Clostridiales bacterium]|nr:SGNH/GDSL hydrolase family protein [Clostridiales bacterium]